MDAQGVPITGDTDWSNPRWNYPEYPPGSVVEIRVHGVGGEPPSGMTRDASPRNIGGDALAGFWRARNPVVGELASGAQHVREVLAWGGRTSGTIRHAFWVTLFPFALFNLAGRMGPSGKRRATIYRSVARVLAYTMTLSVVALTSAGAFDVLGRQAVQEPQTGGLLGPPLRIFREPAERLGFAALFPVAILIMVWLAGKYKAGSLEGHAETGDRSRTEPVRLDDDDFWRNAWSTSRLRATHATGGFAFIAATMALVLGDIAPADERCLWMLVLGFSCAVVIGCGSLVALPAMARPGKSVPLHHVQWVLRLVALGTLVPSVVVALAGRVPNPPTWVSVLLFAAASIALILWVAREVGFAHDRSKKRPNTSILGNLLPVFGIAALVVVFTSGPSDLADVDTFRTQLGEVPASLTWLPAFIEDRLTALGPNLYLPAYAMVLPLVLGQVMLLALLFGFGLERKAPRTRTDANPPGRAFPFNVGGVVVALLALLAITSVSASLHALAIDLLGKRATVPAPGSFTFPWWYALTAWIAAFGLPLMLGLTFAVRTIVRKVGSGKVNRPKDQDIVDDLNRGIADPKALTPDERLKKLRGMWMFQRLLRDGGWMLTVAVGLATGGLLGYFMFVWRDDDPVTRELPLESLAVWVVTALAGVVIALFRSALRNKELRRKIGVIWDVAAFWPRVTHPFAPPCYGEAIVPMLDRRITDLTDHRHGYRVVLAGHSQGSVLALATAVRHEAARAHLVTYGSPIVILFEAFFSEVFGGPDGAIVRGEARTHSWHHLFGMSEPFAMPFWRVTDASADDLRSGWPANVHVPHAVTVCPVCGWRRGKAPLTVPKGKDHHTDFVVSDPCPWKAPLDPVDPAPKGHSTYHDNREVDLHLARIAAVASGAT